MNRRRWGAALGGLVLVVLWASAPEILDLVDAPTRAEDLEQRSLLVSTLLLGFVDGFNPCSLWVLAVLLGLVLHAGRRKLLLVGATFLLVTGTIYGLFVAGVLSVFTYVAYLEEIRTAVGLFAVGFAAICVKDFVSLGWGVSATIPESAKPGIYDRARAVVRTEGRVSTVAATALLSGGVALVELPCTAGFPVVWSNLVAVHDPGTAAYVGLVLTYVLAYLSVEIGILAVAALTLARFRYDAVHARVLKLLAGTVLGSLGIALLVRPTILVDVRATAWLFGAAVLLTTLLTAAFHATGRLENGTGGGGDLT